VRHGLVDWHHVRRHLDRLHAVTFTGPTGTFRQRTDPTKPQADLYARLGLEGVPAHLEAPLRGWRAGSSRPT
jgi:hypothetical protein